MTWDPTAATAGDLLVVRQDLEPTNVAETLRAARKLIEDPAHWIKGEYARIGKGRQVTDPRSDDAGAFCALGALKHVDGPHEWDARNYLLDALPPRAHQVASFNDRRSTTHEDVLALYDRAIAAAESRDS